MNAKAKPEALIEQAMSACRTLPPHGQLVELDEQLRGQLVELVRVVRAQAARMDHGVPGWHGRQRALDATRNALDEDLGSSPLAAAMAIAEFGRRLRELTRYAAGDDA